MRFDSDRNAKHGLTSRLVGDIRWGMKGALTVAGFYCVLLLVLALFNSNNPKWGYGYSILTILLVYGVVAVVGGAVAGLLRPILPSWPGSLILGMFLTSLFFVAMRQATDGFAPWRRWEYYGVLLFAIALGIPAGVTIHKHQQRERQ